jgi:hypothetical protein
MKNKIDIKSILLGTLLAAVIILSIAAAADGRTEWEYKVITGNVLQLTGPRERDRLELKINNQVAEGWQFVSASGAGEMSGFAVMRREKQ